METHRLTRSGDAPLSFTGEPIAENDGSQQSGKAHNRWHDLVIYRTEAGRYVVRIAYNTIWDGETGHMQAVLVTSAADVAGVFRKYDPTSRVLGYPVPSSTAAPDPYAERRERLNRDIRARYEQQVSALLDSDLFATSEEISLTEQYSGMDHQALLSFVRVTLADFPLTRAEACALCDANNGAMLFPEEYCWSGLWVNIEDTPAADLSAKWNCDAQALANRIRAADRATQFALSVAVATFWRDTFLERDEALRLAGFTIKEIADRRLQIAD